jgi:hypothetical protein
MKRLLVPLLVCLAILCGCASQYVMRLNNGSHILTASKPRLKNGAYFFKDAKGQEVSVPQGRVIQIEPVSMAREEAKAQAQQMKKRPWWKFW